MIRAGVLALLLAVPAGAEGLAGQALCEAVWAKVGAGLAETATVSGTVAQEGDWCAVEDARFDLRGEYVPDWHADTLRFRGAALGWFADGATLPEGLDFAVEGLRLVIQTGNAQMDWLFAAQARPNRIDATGSLAWDAAGKVLRLERLSVDFPGENLIDLSAVVTGVDLSSSGAMQMSATSFALTEADLRVTAHGLFEWYALMSIGPTVLPSEGDMEAAAARIRAELVAMVGDLPGTSFSDASKAALVALIGELPNPAGDLAVSLRAEPGIGPVRFGGYAITGVPETLAEAAPLFQGVVVDVAWTHVDAP